MVIREINAVQNGIKNKLSKGRSKCEGVKLFIENITNVKNYFLMKINIDFGFVSSTSSVG